MQDRLPDEAWDLYLEHQSGIHDHEPIGIDKTSLAMTTIEQYAGLVDVLGHTTASEEMALALGEYVLQGELNEFEADMIATLAILGKIATYALDENERLQGGISG